MGYNLYLNSGLFTPKENETTDTDNSTCDDKTCNYFVHIRVQKRNSRKCITTVEGLDNYLIKEKILKTLKCMKREFCCNGCLVDDDNAGQVLQLQGDRKRVSDFLIRLPNPIEARDHSE